MCKNPTAFVMLTKQVIRASSPSKISRKQLPLATFWRISKLLSYTESSGPLRVKTLASCNKPLTPFGSIPDGMSHVTTYVNESQMYSKLLGSVFEILHAKKKS